MVTRLFNRIAGWERHLAVGTGGSRTGKKFLPQAIWIVCVILLVLVVKNTGFPVIWNKVNDAIALMDAGWRVWNGQVPHRDFYSVIGPFPLGVFSLGFALRAQDIEGFPLGLLAVGIGLSVLSWWITRDRLTPWWRLFVAIQILLLPVAVVFLGGGEDLGGGKGPPFDFVAQTSYAMLVNRLGWATFVLEMLIVLIPPRNSGTPRRFFAESFVVGALAGLCVYCKINYSLAAVGLAAWWLLWGGNRALRSFGILAGFLVTSLMLGIYPGGVMEYFADQSRLLQVSRHESQIALLLVRVRANLPWLLVLPLLQLSLLSNEQSRKTEIGPNHQPVWLWSANFLVAIAASLFVTTFNTQRGEVPGLVIAGLITVEMILRARDSVSNTALTESDGAVRTKCLAAKIACAVLLFSAVCYDAGSLVYAMVWKGAKPRWVNEAERWPGMLAPLPVPVFFNEPTEKMAVEKAIVERRSGPWMNTGRDNFMTPRQTVRWVNDGVELLKPLIKPTDRIFVAAWFNPFNLALGLPPAKGGATLWDWDRLVGERIHPDVAATLQEVTIFMVPKRADWTEQRDFMLRIYGHSLGSDFQVAGESQFWTCWRRRSP